MKALFLALMCSLFLTHSLTSFAQCQSVDLSNQEEIDSFVANYGCSSITGSLIIGVWENSTTGITNLSGLAGMIDSIHGSLMIRYTGLQNLEGLESLVHVGGFIWINNNESLSDVSGLQNLSSFNGNFNFHDNSVLPNFNGLENISTIGTSLRISDNDALSSLSGLENITTIGESLVIEDNPLLQNLEELQNLTSIGLNIEIKRNDLLEDLSALENISSIGGDLKINDNISLPNLSGLENLTSIGGELKIADNPALISIAGLGNLSTIGTNIQIRYNEMLPTLIGLENVMILDGDLLIIGNDLLPNLEGLQNITTIGGYLQIANNPILMDIDALQNLTSIEEGIGFANNPILDNIDGLQNLSNTVGQISLTQNYELNDIDAFQNLSNIEGDIALWGNSSLTNLDGLQNIYSVGGDLKVTNHPELLDLNGLQNLFFIGGLLQISDNDALTDLTGLGSLSNIEGNLQILSNNSLSDCCIALNFLNGVEGEIFIQSNAPNCNSVEEIHLVCANETIQVQAFYDENENSLFDENEQFVQQAFSLSPSELFSYGNNQGSAYFYLENFGSYTIALQDNPLWNLVGNTSSISIDYLDSIFTDTLHYFPVVPVSEFVIQRVDLASSITRCNQETNYWLTYTNEGTTINDGYIQLVADEFTDFISANPPADSIVGDTLYWFYEDLYPTHSNQIHLVYEMPGVSSLGEEIVFEAEIQTNEGVGDSKKIIGSELICAYDPNDKLVRPAGVGVENYTLFEDTLEYTIRFQNTGNDTAFTVIIEDELSEALDLNTFRPIASSHNLETQIDLNTRLATFTFNDIYLPDSFVNEPASHGFVKFQIQGMENIESFTAIENTANIFFDFNPAIVTNTVLNTFTETIPSVFLGKVFLEGCYEGDGIMSTDLTEWLPLSQPFNEAPYNYNGTESLTSIPDEMVDWVLVEARTGSPNLSGEAGTTVVEQIAGLLLNDGTIVNTDRTTGLRFLNLEEESHYYFSIRHQNHLDVLSANPLVANLSMNYDFSLNLEMAFGNQQQKLSDDGNAFLFSGDANGDGLILNTDYDLWFFENAILNTYSPTDWNLDGVVQTTDYDLWFLNKAKVGIVELQY